MRTHIHTCTLIHSFLSHPTPVQDPNTCSAVHLFTLIQRIMRLKPILKIILNLNLCQTVFPVLQRHQSLCLSLNVRLCQDRRLFIVSICQFCVIAIIYHSMWLFLQMVRFLVLANFLFGLLPLLLGRMIVERNELGLSLFFYIRLQFL